MTTYISFTETKRRLLDALAPLGSTPGEVAVSLATHGCYGDHRCCSCPINQFLSRTVPGTLLVRANKWYSTLMDCADHDEGNARAVREFIRQFDNGNYISLYKEIR